MFCPIYNKLIYMQECHKYILILRFHDDLECKTWVHNYFALVFVTDDRTDGPQYYYGIACVGSSMARNLLTDLLM